MQKIKGTIYKNGSELVADVEFNILTQVIGGCRSTTGSFQLRRDVQLPIDQTDPMYDVTLKDGSSFRFAISSRIADGALQHFDIKILGL